MIGLTEAPSLDEMESTLRETINRIHYDHQVALERAIAPYTRELCKLINLRNPSFTLIEINGQVRQYFERKQVRRVSAERRKS